MSVSNKDHPVQGVISQILAMQDRPEFTEPRISENEQYAFARDKVFLMAQVLRSLLESTPAELTSSAGLNQLQNNLQAPLNELTSFLANGELGHILNAATQFEQNILPLVWSFGPQLQNFSPDSLSRLFESQAATSRATVQQLVAQREALAASLQKLSVKTAEQISQFDLLTTGSAKERAEAAAAVAKLEQQFAEKETERAAKFEETVTELRKDFSVFEGTSRAEAADLISKLEFQRSEAARIVQVVGNIGVTGNYQQIANAEAGQANFWRWVTVAVFGGGLTVAGATFVKFWGQPFNAENAWSVVIRLLYAIAITAPAWYTARESARHRTNSDRARQTELELASIGPFIELMPEEKKIQIRKNLTPLYFGKTVEAHIANNPFDATAVKDMALELVKLLKK